MVDLIRCAADLQTFFRERGWSFCFIGGIALQAWGEPRLTRDVDVSLFTGFGDEGRYVADLLAHFSSRIDGAEGFALDNRVLLLVSADGIPFDVAMAGFPFEEAIIGRAQPVEFLEDVSLNVCSADDLVVLKAFANRAKDWMDIEGIILRQRSILDRPQILDLLTPLCDLREDPGILSRLTELFGRHP
jgi:hypothetical protein